MHQYTMLLRMSVVFTTLLAITLPHGAIAQTTAPDAPQSASQPLGNGGGGAGDLLIAPTRAVLEGRTRSADITLSNKGNKEATYRMSFIHLRMEENGSYKEITEEEAKNTLKIADSLVRYSPRQVTLKPGESQVVKIMANKPEGLADGEYISHMLFRATPDLAKGEDVEAQKDSPDQISVRLVPVYGVSIPVIVRQGELSAQAKLLNPSIDQGKLNLTISRSGNKSIFGDILVTQTGTSNVVGQLRGVGVLPYINQRSVSVPVTQGGALTVEYRQREDDGGNMMDKIDVR